MAKDYDIAVLLDFYGELLTEKRREFINYYYNEDLSLSEIAENEGLSRQGVHDTVKKAEEQLRELESALHMAEKFRSLNDKADRIAALAQTLCESDDADIRRTAASIAAITRELKDLG